MLKLNPIFSSNMIFQANKPVRIFGTGNGKVTIDFLGQTKSIVSQNENWLIEFDPQNYGGPHTLIVTLNNEKHVLDNVYFGDVYMIAGQSNMQLRLKQTNEPQENYKTNHNVVSFSLDRPEKDLAFKACDGWIPCEKETAGEWSAVGYHVGHMMNERTDRKIGLIFCFQGASTIQAWLPNDVMAREKLRVTDEQKYQDHRIFPWNREECWLYNFMTSKLIPFSMNSVVWYQGESNCSDAESAIYTDLLEALITSYRDLFRDKDLPFVIVQIADFDGRDFPAWHKIQQCQLDIQNALHNVKTVISKDVCETDDIHPKSKKELSRRIADTLEKFLVK